MTPEANLHILRASLAGGLAGILVMWNRRKSQIGGQGKLRGLATILIGTIAITLALNEFATTFGAHSRIFAVIVMTLLAGWTAILQSAVQLPIPRVLLRVGASEWALLRSPWSGVRVFGALLRNTPLRHLGGRVYLSNESRDPTTVVLGIYAAESVHLWAILFSLPWFVAWGMQGYWAPMGWALVVQLPLNIYPTLHLRFVTWRIERYTTRMKHDQRA